ncbi:aminotransferase class III-fold pyridoxal phosphate-dependent enzyme [Mesorhizobium sp. M0684]|uniref:aspartate aminotransferase family protein n=1 Tax=Mesorhizobium sp. M0684 TaxID=2956986 RepID=UPI00333C12B7
MKHTAVQTDQLSRLLSERAHYVMPGGNTRLNAFSKPYPLYISHGKGFSIFDVDGHGYVDFVNNFTTLLHGHAYQPINAVLAEQMERGLCFGWGTEQDILLAEAIVARHPYIETIRFANSGTEAVMFAVKAARAFTGKTAIARCEGAWHGGYDWADVSTTANPAVWGNADPRSVPGSLHTPGHVLEDVVVIPFNDVDWTRKILTERAGNLGAIIIDPLPSRIGMIPITPEYAAFINEFCRENDILLICDEVLCNRLAYHGASKELGLEPDLVTLGKIIGGGLPIGAFGGRADVMAVFDPSNGSPAVPHSGTFVANPMSMVAGCATLANWTPDAISRLNKLSEDFRDGLNERFKAIGAKACVSGGGSLFKIHLKSEIPVTFREGYPTPQEKAQLESLINRLKNEGYLVMTTGGGALSTPMTADLLQDFTAAIEDWAKQELAS